MPDSQSECVLVVEDERKISEAVAAGLKSAGYEVITARTVEDGFFILHSHRPDMIVLDLGLPGRSGMEMLRQVRSMKIKVPILILTSNNSLDDRVAALDLGADDFLLKPFSTAELNARMRAISRRGKQPPSPQLTVADLEINLETRTAMRGSTKLELTTREFDLLVYFLNNRGRTVSREMLARDVWHETSRFTPIDNVIDVQITRLRRKLDDPFPQKLLRTIRGVGFHPWRGRSMTQWNVKELRPKNLRTRLTLWYMGLFTLVLLVYLVVVYVFQYGLLTSQIYHDEIQDVETVEGLLRFDSQGELTLDQSYHSHPQSHLLADRLMEVRDFTGTVLYRTDTLHGMTLGKVTQTNDEGDSSFNERTVRLADGSWALVISHRHPVRGRMLLIRLGYSLSPLVARMRNFLFALILALPLALVCAGFAGFTIVRKSLAPLDAMASRAEQITAYELSGRLEVESRQDELGRVAVVFNSLLERLERSFAQLQRFTADAAHELRTPLSSIRVVGESALRSDQSAAQYRETISSMLEETLRLNQTVEGLLLISRAEAGEIRLELTSFSVHELVGDLLSILDVLLEESGLTVKEHTLEPARMVVRADRTLIRTCLLNVLHNAAKFSPAGGSIGISYAHFERDARKFLRVSVDDEGPGISAENREKVFERFFRVRDAPIPAGDGVGLGLAIARLAVEANSGSIYFDPDHSRGALCQIEIPT